MMQPRPHPVAVTVLELCTIENQLYMMSGDRNGYFKVFNTNGFNVVLDGQVQNDPQKPL